ncbi:MAG: hypothetical protein NXI07_07910, partial [bacterium]|nr:hypothetical protein [bacterium]
MLNPAPDEIDPARASGRETDRTQPHEPLTQGLDKHGVLNASEREYHLDSPDDTGSGDHTCLRQDV